MQHRGMLLVVGTGIQWGGQTTLGAKAAIETADCVLFAVADVETARWIRALAPAAESFKYPRDGRPRRQIYREMVEQILGELRKGKKVCAAFYGHPGVLADAPHEAVRRALAEGHEARMLPGVSFLDCLFCDLAIDPGRNGCQVFEAGSYLSRRPAVDVRTPLVLCQIAMIDNRGAFDPGDAARIRAGLAELSSALRERYPAEHEAILYEAPSHPSRPARAERVRLHDLAGAACPETATLYVPPVTEVTEVTAPAAPAKISLVDVESARNETRRAEVNMESLDQKQELKKCMTRGEMCRQEGNYATAIEHLGAAIDLAREVNASAGVRAWLHAHRAAAKGGMVHLFGESGADEDFEAAVRYRKSYGWAYGQWAEAYRMYVLQYFPTLALKDVVSLLAASIQKFGIAMAQQPGDAWLHAHRGAAFANAYWGARRLPFGGQDSLWAACLPENVGVSSPIEDVLAALSEADLRRAIKLNPSYAWAHAFHGFMLTLQDRFAEGMEALGQGQLYDVNQRLTQTLLHNMSKLWSYQGAYAQSITAGFQGLRKDPFDEISAYFVAVGLKKTEHACAAAAIRHVRNLIESSQRNNRYMMVSLRHLEGAPVEELWQELQEALCQGDLEVRSLFFHDPTWQSLGEDRESIWANVRARIAAIIP
jgi:tetratricopeptide (TPR) repeat protein